MTVNELIRPVLNVRSLRGAFLFFLICWPFVVVSQEFGGTNLRVKTLPVSDSIVLDSLSLVPGSITVLPEISYFVDESKSLIVFERPFRSDSVQITYRVLPLNLSQPYYRKDTTLMTPDVTGTVNPFIYDTPPETGGGAGSFSQLSKTGSISRGVSLGNNQNLGVNSNLNMQLAGNVTEDIQVRAAISDENIPVQPDGNTQTLQDFDQVFIEVFDDNSKLTAGDFMIKEPKSYFLQYNKRLRGGQVETGFDLNEEGTKTNKVGLGAAVSRGKFSRNIIQGVEGNQGPYRLEGAENENFIIILSGTEEVFIDGRKLERGQEYDYIIDYNQAEITFTAKQPITKDKRIIVEFQYSSQAFARSLVEFHDELDFGKLKLNFNAYSEQDSRNRPFQQELNEQQIDILQNIGNDIDNAFAPSINNVGFRENEILYKLVREPVPGTNIDSFFVFSTNPDSAIYQLQFSEVGQGNGNYNRSRAATNGAVYEFVPPVNGEPQGRFEPIILLVTPKKRQMYTLGGSYEFSEKTRTHFELALSNSDENTYSEIGNENNVGYGFNWGIETQQELSKGKQPLTLQTGADLEYVDRNFNPIERFRDVEFDREWNIRDLTLTQTQILPGAFAQLNKKNLGTARYNYRGFLGGDEYEAHQHGALVKGKYKGFDVDFNAFQTTTDGELSKSNYYRHLTHITKDIKNFRIGYRDDVENNQRFTPGTDSLNQTAYRWYEWETFLETADSNKNYYRFGYTYRTDDAAPLGDFERSTLGESYSFQFGLDQNPKSRLSGKVTYRTLEVQDTNTYEGDPEENLIARLEYTFKAFKGALTSTSFYEIGTGLEEERDFVYVEVAPGRGIYQWIDYNDNGIQEQDEFEIARFPDQARFIRVAVRTNEFVRTYMNQFNQMLNLNPARTWSAKKGVRGFLSKFSNQATFRVNRKTLQEDGLRRLNPFYTSVESDVLVTLNSSLRNTMFFNRNSRTFAIEWTYQDLANQNLLTNGIESRTDKFNRADVRINISPQFQINLVGSTGNKGTASEFFSNRNFNIEYLRGNPKITYQPSPAFELAVGYDYTLNENTIDEGGGETSTNQKITGEVRWNSLGKGSLNVRANLVQIDFEGEANSALAFEMLEGLMPGTNGTWEVILQRSIGENLQLNINYNGRVSQGSNVIHTGGMQVRAYF